MKKLTYCLIVFIIFTTLGYTTDLKEYETVNQINLIQKEIPHSVNYYIGNKNTKKFHLPSCSFLPYEHNRIYFTEREDAINSYFDPCLKCEP